MSAINVSQVRSLLGRRPRPNLRLVPGGRAAAMARAPFALLVAVLVSAGLIGLLMLNTSMQAGAFEAASLQSRNQLLADQQADLERQAQALSSPESVTAKAAALGMVANPDPGFLRLSDGAVLGDPQAAPAPPRPAAKKATEKKATDNKKSTEKTSAEKKQDTRDEKKKTNEKQDDNTQRTAGASAGGGGTR